MKNEMQKTPKFARYRPMEEKLRMLLATKQIALSPPPEVEKARYMARLSASLDRALGL